MSVSSTLARRGAAVSAALVALAPAPAARAQVRDCGPPARVVAVSPTHRARIAEQPVRRGAAIAVGAEIRVPPGGWLRMSRRGADLRLAHGRVLLECADTRLETGRLTLIAARSRPARAVLATPQAALAAAARTARSSWRSVAGLASGSTRASRA